MFTLGVSLQNSLCAFLRSKKYVEYVSYLMKNLQSQFLRYSESHIAYFFAFLCFEFSSSLPFWCVAMRIFVHCQLVLVLWPSRRLNC